VNDQALHEVATSENRARQAHAAEVVYRPDIDGLRAVAVLAVIGFHASAGWFPGGYVGVDIFFVISGFLITSIIARQVRQGRFSFVDFYARRCKRIFPSLIVVLLAVVAYGWLVLLPDEYERLGKHVAAGAGFISNFAFWVESGYFDKSAGSKPLLHLWSLGIEEQFYLLWPPILLWAWKRKWNPLNVAVGIVSVSFAINIMLVSLWQARDTYYLPPTRFWELLLGGALACAQLFLSRRVGPSAEAS
jgi:peptidoglycan/LPS O-acetylase OafA/YrhL